MKTRMRTSKVLAMCVMAAMLGLSPVTNAALVNHGDGLVYDTDLDITWYVPVTSAMARSAAYSWAASLTVHDTVAGSWRLPSTTYGVDWGYDTDGGNGEMAHLYYTELGNLQDGGLTNKGPFTNLLAADYWSGTVWWRNGNLNCDFNFSNGYRRAQWYDENLYVLAVHAGNVPEPATMCLLGLGALSLISRKK